MKLNVALGAIQKVIFVLSVWDKKYFFGNRMACMSRQNNPTPECLVNGTECYDS